MHRHRLAGLVAVAGAVALTVAACGSSGTRVVVHPLPAQPTVTTGTSVPVTSSSSTVAPDSMPARTIVPPAESKPASVVPGGVVEMGVTVADVQTALHIPVSGQWDQTTHDAVIGFQASQHIAVDALVGPVTWGRLHPSTHPAQSSQPAPAPGNGGSGCGAALAYLATNAAPGFTFVCAPHAAFGAYGMTCLHHPPQCSSTGSGRIMIACPSYFVYANEAHNSQVFAGRARGIDPNGQGSGSQDAYCNTLR